MPPRPSSPRTSYPGISTRIGPDASAARDGVISGIVGFPPGLGRTPSAARDGVISGIVPPSSEADGAAGAGESVESRGRSGSGVDMRRLGDRGVIVDSGLSHAPRPASSTLLKDKMKRRGVCTDE